MKTKQLVLAAAMLAASAAAAPAADINDVFVFEYYNYPRLHIGTDQYRNYTDFVHYNDYYRFGNLDDPDEHITCKEATVAGDNGGAVRRITCTGFSGRTFLDR